MADRTCTAAARDGVYAPGMQVGTATSPTTGAVMMPWTPATQYQVRDLLGSSGLARKVAERPARDALRRLWRVTGLSGTDERGYWAEVRRLGVVRKLRAAATWARAYGGAALLVVDGAPPSEPLDGVSRIQRLDVVTRFDLAHDGADFVRVAGSSRIHRSRVLAIYGDPLPPDMEIHAQGWGDSVIWRGRSQILAVEIVAAMAPGLLSRSFQSVLKSDDLVLAQLAGQGEQVQARIDALSEQLAALGLIVTDRKREEYGVVSSGTVPLLDTWRVVTEAFLAAFDAPRLTMLGYGVAGLGGGDLRGETRAHYDWVESYREDDLDPVVGALTDLILRQQHGPTSGRVPADIVIEWPSLWTPEPEESARVRLTHAQARALEVTSGVVWPHEARTDPVLAEYLEIDPDAPPPDRPDTELEWGPPGDDATPDPGLAPARMGDLPDGERPIRATEADDRLGVRHGTVARWCAAGLVPYVRPQLGTRPDGRPRLGRYMVAWSQVAAMMSGAAPEPPEPAQEGT